MNLKGTGSFCLHSFTLSKKYMKLTHDQNWMDLEENRAMKSMAARLYALIQDVLYFLFMWTKSIKN